MVISHFSHRFSPGGGVGAGTEGGGGAETAGGGGVMGGDDDDENVRCHRYDRHSRHRSRHQQHFSRAVATSRLTHARCVNLIWGCCSLCWGTLH